MGHREQRTAHLAHQDRERLPVALLGSLDEVSVHTTPGWSRV